MKVLSTSLFAALLMMGSSVFADPSQVYGRWALQMAQNGFTFKMQLNIGQSQTIFSNTCTYQGKTATASVAVTSQVTEKQLVITGSGKENKSIDGLNCNVEVHPQQIDYEVRGNVLHLTILGQSADFQRVQ